MPNDQTVKDARMLLEAFSTNHAEASVPSRRVWIVR